MQSVICYLCKRVGITFYTGIMVMAQNAKTGCITFLALAKW